MLPRFNSDRLSLSKRMPANQHPERPATANITDGIPAAPVGTNGETTSSNRTNGAHKINETASRLRTQVDISALPICYSASRFYSRPRGTEGQNTKDDSLFWDQYVKEAELCDRELVKTLGGDLDTLLIFAGLFSAVNTGIIVEAFKDLKPDPAESGGTNELLRTLIRATNSSIEIAPPKDYASTTAVVVCTLFFASLWCSLAAAFGSVMAKQWLNKYERIGDNRIPHARARQRHAKFLGIKKYHFEKTLRIGGTVLQISLAFFFFALGLWLFDINGTVCLVPLGGSGAVLGFYIVAINISVRDPASPYATRFSAFLHRKLNQPTHSGGIPATFGLLGRAGMAIGMVRSYGMVDTDGSAGSDQMDQMDWLDGKCVAWVRDNATTFESVAGMARAAASLPDHIRRTEGLNPFQVGPKLLRSVISSNAISLGLTNGTLFSTVHTIRSAMTSWQGVPLDLACDVIAQLHQILRIAVPKDPVLSELIALTLEGVDAVVPSDLVLRTRRPEAQTFIDLIQVPALTVEGKRAALSLLWKYHFRERYWEGKEEILALCDDTNGPLKDSWPWKVADALAGTATSGAIDDRDVGRLEFRVCWAAGLGPTSRGGSKGMGFEEQSSVSPVWKEFFQTDSFKRHFTRRLIPSLHRHPYFGMVATDAIASSIGPTFFVERGAPHSNPVQPPRTNGDTSLECVDFMHLNLNILEAAFQVQHDCPFRAVRMAPLYIWFHLQQHHAAVQLPAACVNMEYLRCAVYDFLQEQLSERSPWMPAEHAAMTVNAIRAYVEHLPAVDARTGLDDFKFERAHSLLQQIRAGSYRYKGPASEGQQLWDCFAHILGVFSGRVLTEGDDIVDWAKIEEEGLTILGSEADAEPVLEIEPAAETLLHD